MAVYSIVCVYKINLVSLCNIINTLIDIIDYIYQQYRKIHPLTLFEISKSKQNSYLISNQLKMKMKLKNKMLSKNVLPAKWDRLIGIINKDQRSHHSINKLMWFYVCGLWCCSCKTIKSRTYRWRFYMNWRLSFSATFRMFYAP